MNRRGTTGCHWLAALPAALLLVLPATATAETVVGQAAAAVSAVDDAGKRISLPAPARRVVSLAPHATELLFAVGAGNAVVGADEYSDYPEAARQIARIGRAGALDVERILALKPDLVVAWGSGNTGGQVAQLQRFGLPVFISEPRGPETIATSLRRLGALTGHAAVGDREAADFAAGFARLRTTYAHRAPVSVFYQIWNEPLMTVNATHSIGAVISLCGGRNIFADLPTLAPTVNIEAVVHANPDVIIGSGADDTRPQWLDDWRRWPTLAAVRHGNLFDVPPNLVQRPTSRLLEGAQRVCAALEIARGRKLPAERQHSTAR